MEYNMGIGDRKSRDIKFRGKMSNCILPPPPSWVKHRSNL
jgi:hypothetical protein